jgi:hypothetical protein
VRFVPRGFVHLSGLISFNEGIERLSVDSPGRSRHTPLGIRRGFGPQLVGYSGENHSRDGRQSDVVLCRCTMEGSLIRFVRRRIVLITMRAGSRAESLD